MGLRCISSEHRWDAQVGAQGVAKSLNGLIGNICGVCFYINSLLFFRICLIWALGGYKIGQKNGGWLTKISPARHTHFGEFFGQLFGPTKLSKNAPQNKSVTLMEAYASQFSFSVGS